MADLVDLPLDEIINIKKINLKRSFNSNAGGRSFTNSSGGVAKAKTSGAVRLNRSAPLASSVKSTSRQQTGDARNNIIQRKRQTIGDARDALARIAKTIDARDKINKLKTGGSAKNQITLTPSTSTPGSKMVFDIRSKLNQSRGVMQKQSQQQSKTVGRVSLNAGNQGGSINSSRKQGSGLVRTVTLNSRLQQRPTGNAIQRVSSAPTSTLVTVRNSGASRSNNARLQPARIQHQIMRVASAPSTLVQRRPRVIQQQPQTIRRMRPAAQAPTVVYRTRQPPTQVVYQTAPPPTVVYQDEPQYVDEPEPIIVDESGYAIQEEYQDYTDGGYQQPQQLPVYYEDEYVDEVHDYSAPVVQQQYGPAPPPHMTQQQRYQPQQQQQQQRSNIFVRPQQQQQQQQQQPRAMVVQQQQQQPRVQQQQQQQQQHQRIQQQQQPQPLMQQQQPRMQQHRMQQQQQQQQQPRIQQQQIMQQHLQPQVQQQQQQPRRVQQPSPQQRMQQPARRAPAPQSPRSSGHRVLVTNLHPVATHEDIEELFGNIGATVSTKMTRPGQAMVVFRTLQDAKKAVEVYHNRKLDGQPMQVKITGPAYDGNSASSRLAAKY